MEDILRGSLCFKGEKGDSAYEIAVQEGFKGSKEVWLEQIGGIEEINKLLPLNIKNFGAKGDGVTDDTEAIKAAINMYLEGDYDYIYIPKGEYLVSEPLDIYKHGKRVVIVGSDCRDAIIKASKEMDYVISFGVQGNYSQFYIEKFSVRCSDKANLAIDAKYSAYSTCRDMFIQTVKPGSTCIKLGSWCNRLINTFIYGEWDYTGNSLGIVPATGLAIEQNESTNNLIIRDCIFGLIGTAIKIDHYANDIHITNNTFDYCGKVILATAGCKNIVFTGNYLEACGGRNDVQYTEEPYTYTVDGYTRSLNSAFILHEHTSMRNQLGVSIKITDNQFANCYKEKLLSISGSKCVIFKNNDFYGLTAQDNNYSYNDLIYIFGVGVYGAEIMKLEFENRYPNKIKNMVVYDNDYDKYYYNNGLITYFTNTLANVSSGSKYAKLGSNLISIPSEITINSSNQLEVKYTLSDEDMKHPHHLIVNGETISGETTLTVNGVSGDEFPNVTYNKAVLNGTTSSNYTVNNERDTHGYKSLVLYVRSTGSATIDSVYLEVANGHNKMIRLI